MEKLKNKYLEIGELTKEQIKWINKEIPGTLDLDFDYYIMLPLDLRFTSVNMSVKIECRNRISFNEFKEIYESYKVKSKKDKYTVKCEKREQTIKVLNYIFEDTRSWQSKWKYVTRFDFLKGDFNQYNKYDYTVISFEEWQSLPDEDFVLPEEWCIEVTKDNLDTINNWMNNKGWGKLPSARGYIYNTSAYALSKFNEVTEITFEQFKEHVLGKENINKLNNILTNISDKVNEKLKEKYHESQFNDIKPISEFPTLKPNQIIGYKLVKEEYEEVAARIAFAHISTLTNFTFNNYGGFNFTFKCIAHKALEKAGVMHWFEPIYKPETITLKSGVELSESDIEEVKQILNK